MTNPVQLAAAVASRLAPTISPNLTAATSASDLYEAYVYTLVLSAAQSESFGVTFHHISTPPPGVLTFRTSPGHIYTATQPFSYSVLTAPSGVELEAHVGVRVRGKSQVAHECDVLILRRDEAVACRLNRVDPRHYRAELCVECKFYAISLDLGLLRGFVGLSADLAGPVSTLASNVSSVSVSRLFKSHKRKWEDDLTPGSVAEERFIGDVRSILHRCQSL